MSSVTIQEIAHRAYFQAAHLPDGVEPALEETAHFEGPPATFSNATHAVVLEVDPATGGIRFHKYVVVQDAGRILNPLIVGGRYTEASLRGSAASFSNAWPMTRTASRWPPPSWTT